MSNNSFDFTPEQAERLLKAIFEPTDELDNSQIDKPKTAELQVLVKSRPSNCYKNKIATPFLNHDELFNPQNIDISAKKYRLKENERIYNILKQYGPTTYITCMTSTGYTVLMYYLKDNEIMLKTLEDESDITPIPKEDFMREFPGELLDKSTLTIGCLTIPEYSYVVSENGDWRPTKEKGPNYSYRIGDILVHDDDLLEVVGIRICPRKTVLLVDVNNETYSLNASEADKYPLLRFFDNCD